MAERCGSYPLMNLAQDFSLDYGDVLLVADVHRSAENLHGPRFQMYDDAGRRIDTSLAPRGFAAVEFWQKLQAHVQRDIWGRRPPSPTRFIVTVEIVVETVDTDAARKKVEHFIDYAEIELGPECEDYTVTIKEIARG